MTSRPLPRHAVIVASVGRAELLALTIARLAEQTRVPDLVLVVAVADGDVAGVGAAAAAAGLALEVHFAAKGLPIQRNVGLARLGDRADYVTFFDDDFVPALDFLEVADAIYHGHPGVIGLTGRLIADGIHTAGFSYEAALAMLATDVPPREPQDFPMAALYGCNMSYRVSALAGLTFDEALPLYGWQEDVDFSFQVGRRGLLLRTEQLSGVHMGAKTGRTSGRRLGYSQISNPVYLLRKQTIPPRLAFRLMRRNIVANIAGAVWPEAHIDRRGRLAGNLLAMRDYVTGRLHPGKILEM